ncbi:signal peptidase I [Alkalibacillus silvisoli]|uniref:Signal peptidase I n=1 Tax=Alkalibacillus silvisoli TaxID=392823 RepID=A0ABP3K587_9BACI
MVKQISKWIFNSFLVLLLLTFVLAFLTTFQSQNQDPPSIFGFHLLNVLSGSMEPKVSPGDIIIVKNTDAIEENDVITFRDHQNNLVTHRVIDVIEESGTAHYETKGDANNTPDHILVTNEEIVGKLSFSIPKAGYMMDFLKGPFGIFTLSMIFLISIGYRPIKRLLSTEGKESKG